MLIGSPSDANVSPVLGLDLDLRRVAFSKVGTRQLLIALVFVIFFAFSGLMHASIFKSG